MSTSKKTTKQQTPDANPLEDAVRKHLGDERLAALAKQPPCLAKGGIDTVIAAACKVSAAWPQPVRGAVVVTLQCCGSKPKPTDLAIKN